jgi:5-methylcytosine-specific restriction endonuclease McrA
MKLDPREYGSRGPCPDCGKARERARVRAPRKQRGYTDQWLQLVKVAIGRQPYCSACGATTNLTGDHRIPLSKGGTSTLENIEVLCRRCNSAKGNRDPGFLTVAARTRTPGSREKQSQIRNSDVHIG